jgi:hypothetical protein
MKYTWNGSSKHKRDCCNKHETCFSGSGIKSIQLNPVILHKLLIAQPLNPTSFTGPYRDPNEIIPEPAILFILSRFIAFVWSKESTVCCKGTNKTPSVAFGPQADFTDWATPAAEVAPTFADRGVSRGQRVVE